MARTLPASQSTDDAPQTQPGDWQALRGELVALLDQVEGQYAQASTGDPSFAGFAQRMRDLRYQVADVDPDDRRREALRSVKRQVDRFQLDQLQPSERGAPEPGPHADNMLQSAIQQIRARTQSPPAAAEAHAAAMPQARPPQFDQLAHSMAGMTGRLAEFEAELRAQRAEGPQVRAIAEQVSQLSQVVELLAGAVGETGQVKRLESQIAGLAQMLTQAPKPDLSQLTERLDGLSATVDRLADLQVQQIQHVVREAEAAPRKDADATKSMQAIEAGVRNIYDRIDGLEHSVTVPAAELDRITGALEQITFRLGADTARPERLLGLVDALNGRINEIEDRNEALGGLKGDIEALRNAVLGAIEPRFASIETQLGELGEKFASRGDGVGMAQLEAQIRQLVARMDQTGEQLSGLARLYGSDERTPAPDYEALANLAATRSLEAMAQGGAMSGMEQLAELAADRAVAKQQASHEALADLVASRTANAVAQAAPASSQMLSERGLAEFEARITRLVDGLARAKPGEGFGGVQDGIGRVEERLKGLEAALLRRGDAKPAAIAPMIAAPATEIPVGSAAPAPVESIPPVRDTMPRNPAADAPLKEFGFPDLGPVRAALEAKNGPRKLHPGIEKLPGEIEPRFEMEPITPEMAGGVSRTKPAAVVPEAPPPAFDPNHVVRPPRPDSSLDAAPLPAAPPAMPAPAIPEVAASSRNTFIEAARRAAQRQNQPPSGSDSNSLIGRAFSRLQAGSTAGKPGKAVPEPVPPEPMQAQTPPVERKTRRKGKAKAVPESMTVPEPALQLADAGLLDTPERGESFLVRHRKPILIAASLVAVSFMTLNLVMQRLDSTNGRPANAASASAATGKTGDIGGAPARPAMAPAAMAHGAPHPAAPVNVDAGHPMTSPKPTSEAASPPASLKPAAGPGPRIIPTDPMTTASIKPALSFAPVTQAAMPAPLAAANAIAAAPGDTAVPSADGKPVALAAIGPAAATGTNATAAPAALDSPVKVDLPPEGLGPLDLRQAAADGDARAQFEIAAIYSEGRAVSQDFKQAEVWYERAAAQGFGPAQYRLGNLYETGKGVPKDLDQARLWYQRAAEGGNRMAMHNLAALYAGGQAGKQDFASAAEWFERAADLGMKDSQFNLGMLYARGLGVPQNLETSYKWFAIAATSGDAGAIKARDNVARSLTPDAIKRLTAEVAAWKVQPINLVANFAPIGTWEKNFNPGAAITDKNVVTKVQLALKRLGYDVGTPDGHAGPKTALAIKAFEHGTGMTEVGSVNPRLLAVLGSQPV